MARPRVFTDKERIERRKAASRTYYAKNKEKSLAWHRKNYIANKARILERNKIWSASNPIAVRQLSLEGTNRRNARLKGADGSHTREEWFSLLELCGNRCVCCGQAKKLTRDHIVPIIVGGSDFIENIQPLCRECNSSKRDKTINYLGWGVPCYL